MSSPDRKSPRPVNTERAAPTRKCDPIDKMNDSAIAGVPVRTKNGKTGITAPNAVASPVTHPSRKGDMPLKCEEQGDDDERDRNDEASQSRRGDLEAFDGTKHGDGWRDHAIPVEERPAEKSERDQQSALIGLTGAMLSLENQRQQCEHPTFAPVIGAQDERDVLHAHDQDEDPRDQRQEAVDVLDIHREPVRRLERLLDRIKRTRSDVAVHDAERREGQDQKSLTARVGLGVMPSANLFALGDCGSLAAARWNRGRVGGHG